MGETDTISTWSHTYYVTNCAPAYSWFGYESPKDDGLKRGQGNYGWRNFKRFLPEIEILKKPLVLLEKIVRPLFQMRSHPRWSANRWKAKT